MVTASVAASVTASGTASGRALVNAFAGDVAALRSIAGGTVGVDLLQLRDSCSPCCSIVDGGGSAEVLEELPLPVLRMKAGLLKF